MVIFKPFGGIALLTLDEVAIRITDDGSRKLNVLLVYMLGTSFTEACAHKLLLLIKLFHFLFSFLDEAKVRV